LGHPDHLEAPGLCASCEAVVRFFDTTLPAAGGGFLGREFGDLIVNCKEKAILFMGHTMRSKSQEKRINEIKLQSTVRRVLVVIDFMMKYEEKHHRESTREHFGKRGKSVHGAAVFFFAADGVVFLRYYHTAMEGDSKQDVPATLSIIEVICYNIKK